MLTPMTRLPDPVDIRQEDLDEYLAKSHRAGYVPLAKIFCRPATTGDETTLSKLVRAHDVATLDLYQLVLVKAVSLRQGDLATGVGPYPARVWGRLLGIGEMTGLSALSRILRRAEFRQLLRREHRGSGIVLYPLREEGDGGDYARPLGGRRRPYLQIPLQYWKDGWDRLLTLPAKAMLLVLLSREDWSVLPFDEVEDWYSITRETAEKGIRELKKVGLLEASVSQERRLLSVHVYDRVTRYRLQPPFGPLSDRAPRRGRRFRVAQHRPQVERQSVISPPGNQPG